jgi:hypothetical protein
MNEPRDMGFDGLGIILSTNYDPIKLPSMLSGMDLYTSVAQQAKEKVRYSSK